MKRVKRTLSFLCIIVLAMSILLGCENLLDINFNVKKGDKYKVVVTSVQKVAEDISGQKINIDQTIKTGYSYDITDVADDGTVTVSIKYDAVSLKMANGSTTYEYDSSKKADSNDPQNLAYEALIGQSFTAKIGKDGVIKEVSGVDKILSNIIDKLQISDESLKASISESLKQSFGDEALKQGLGSMTNIYPNDKKVKVGDSWESKQTITVGYPMIINDKYTLIENKGNIITLDVNSTIDADNSSKPIDLAGLKVKYTLKGTQKGTMKLTKADGFIQSGEVDQNITGTMAVEANDELPDGISIPVSIEAKTSYEVTKQ